MKNVQKYYFQFLIFSKKMFYSKNVDGRDSVVIKNPRMSFEKE